MSAHCFDNVTVISNCCRLSGTGSIPTKLIRNHVGSTNDYSLTSITNSSSGPSGNLKDHLCKDSTE